MKRLLLLVGVFSLLLATSSPAFISSFSGTAGGTGTVTFDAKLVVKRGKCVKRNRRGRCIKRRHRTVATEIEPGMHFSHLPMTCDDGAHTISITKTQPLAVSLGKFSSSGTGSSGGSITLTGQFARGARSATGTIRDAGDFGAVTGCDTGTLTWSASR